MSLNFDNEIRLQLNEVTLAQMQETFDAASEVSAFLNRTIPADFPSSSFRTLIKDDIRRANEAAPFALTTITPSFAQVQRDAMLQALRTGTPYDNPLSMTDLLHTLNKERERLVTLETKLRKAKENYRGTVAARAPQLPADVLSLVFSFLPPTEFPLQRGSSYKPRSFSLLYTICGVCKYWRNVAFDNPALWSSVRFSDVSEELSLHDSMTLESHLRRASSTPILHVEASQEWDLDTHLSIPRAVVPYSSRIRSLHIERFTSNWSADELSLPNLQQLSIGYLESEDSNRAFQSCSRLRSLILMDVGTVPYSAMDVVVPFSIAWNALTSLEMRWCSDGPNSLSADELASLLTNTSSLRHLKLLADERPLHRALRQTSLAILPNLETLEIVGKEVLGAFEVLRLPRLRVLKALRMGKLNEETMDPERLCYIGNFLSQLSHLRELQFSGDRSWFTQDFVALAHRVPSVSFEEADVTLFSILQSLPASSFGVKNLSVTQPLGEAKDEFLRFLLLRADLLEFAAFSRQGLEKDNLDGLFGEKEVIINMQ